MADKTTDISNKEQLIFCLRWVDENLITQEEFIGMHPLENTSSVHIVLVIKDVLI